MAKSTFEIWTGSRSQIEAEIHAADRFAIEGREKMVLYFFGKTGDDCAQCINNAKDKSGGPLYKPGMLLKKTDGEGTDALVIYTAAGRNIDDEIKKDYPDTVDFSDPLYKYSREYIHAKARYCGKRKTGDEIDEIIKRAFYPREVVFRG